MSGGAVAYNLRPNKYVERQLFMELLAILIAGKDPKKFVYVTLGGPQLEDLRTVHHLLGLQNLISLEIDPVILERQLFNLRPSFVKCLRMTTGDFVNDFDPFSPPFQDRSSIVWLDYTAANDRLEQITEVQLLLGKMNVGDVLKLTINAQHTTLGARLEGQSAQAFQEMRLANLETQLGIFIEDGSLDITSVQGQTFPATVAGIVGNAILHTMETRVGVLAVPLAIWSYQDGGHQMLTVTLQLVDATSEAEYREKIVEQGWEFLPVNWNTVTKIDLPNLTPIERLHIEKLLFSDTNAAIHNNLPFRFSSNLTESQRHFDQFAAHYRRYPGYLPISF